VVSSSSSTVPTHSFFFLVLVLDSGLMLDLHVDSGLVLDLHLDCEAWERK